MTLTAVAAVPYDGAGAAWSRELLEDIAFAGLAAGGADDAGGGAWRIAPGALAQAQVNAAGELEAAPAAGAPAILRQERALDAAFNEGGWLVARARAWASEPGQAALSVGFRSWLGPHELRTVHPGGGEWRELRIAVPMPEETRFNPAAYQIELGGGEDGPVRIVAPSLALLTHDTARANAAALDMSPDELLVNGRFDAFAPEALELPYPWRIAQWRGESGAALTAEAVAGEARPVVELRGEVGAGMMLLQTVNQWMLREAGGSALRATALVKAPEGSEVLLRLRVTTPGAEDQVEQVSRGGSGDWAEIALSVRLDRFNFQEGARLNLDLMPRFNGSAPVYAAEASLRAVD